MIRKLPAAVILITLIGLWSVSDGAPPQTKRVYDFVYGINGDSLSGAKVSVELLMADSTKIAYDSVSGVSLGKNPPPFDTTTNTSGYFAVSLIPNGNIIPHGSRYQVTVLYGRRVMYSVRINVTGSDSVRVRNAQ